MEARVGLVKGKSDGDKDLRQKSAFGQPWNVPEIRP